MHSRFLLPLLALALACTTTAQPTWRFHLAFEDGTGARDTIWMVYDTTATTDTSPWPGPNVDSLLGEGEVDIDSAVFNVWMYNPASDTTKTRAYPYSVYPSFDGTIIDAINWTPPMTITWDTSLFHAPYLPYEQGTINRAIMDGLAFSQFGQSGEFGVFNMLIDDSVTIDFLWDYLFPFGIYFGPEDPVGLASVGPQDRPLQVWPNPAMGSIRVAIAPDRTESLTITDLLGRTWLHGPGALLVQPLDITLLPPGRYFIHVRSNNHILHGTFEKIR